MIFFENYVIIILTAGFYIIKEEVQIVFESIGAFFQALIQGEFGFYELWEYFVNLYYAVTKAPDVMNIWAALMKVIDPIYSVVPYIIIILCLVVAFFGKKLMPVLKFLGCFLVGFVCGVYFIGPSLMPIINVPPWVCGLVLAIIAAVLYRFIYLAAYGVSVCYFSYLLCYMGFYMREGVEHTTSKSMVCLAIALGVTVVSFIFIKYIEMLGTAALGGYLISFTIRCMIYDYKALDWLQETPWVGAGVITLIVAVPAFIFQYKTRQRY